jgi:hypothetical protein
MGSDNGKTNTNVRQFSKDSYQPAEVLQRGYQPKIQFPETPKPPHVGSAAIIPSAKAPADSAPATKQK